jgi:diaminopimelate decarboxylase
MSELIRPALYGSWHDIVPVVSRGEPAAERFDVVGPVCESSDVLGVDRSLAVEEGDLLAILSAGAYGMVMSSNYNARPRPAELLVDGERVVEARRAEEIAALYALESRLPAD